MTKCDECGQLKQAANHWKQIGVELEALPMPPNTESQEYAVVSVELGKLYRTTRGSATKYEVRDICGEACLHKHLDRLLASAKS